LVATLTQERFPHGLPQMFHVIWQEVCQVGVLGLIPTLLGRVKIGGVGRQPLDPQPGRMVRQKQSRRFAVRAGTVPYQNERPPHVTMQLSHHRHQVFRAHVPLLQTKIQPDATTLRREGEDVGCRQAIMPVPTILHGRLSARRPGATARGLKHKTALVLEDNASFSTRALFLGEAKFALANGQSPIRRARVRGVPASGNSSSTFATNATHDQHDTSRQSVVESPGLREDMSTSRWNNHWLADLESGFSVIAVFGSRRVVVQDQGEVWRRGFRCLLFSTPPSSA